MAIDRSLLNAKETSLNRASELKLKVQPYFTHKARISTGMTFKEQSHKKRDTILKYFRASMEEWQDWR